MIGEPGRLVVERTTKSFGDNQVLRGIDLDVAGGTIAAVLGPSGCGKTTLLRVLAGFLAAEDGRATLGETVLFDRDRFVPPERRHVGIVPQEGALFGHLNVEDNVGFGVPRGVGRARRVAEMLELVGLRGAERARPFELSGGQQQRVALARALAADPVLVLLDEPFSSLDAALRVHVREDIGLVLRQAGCTAVLVTHDQQEALSLADQVAVMLSGCTAQAGTPRELYSAPTSLAVATFVGDAVVLQGDVRDGTVETVLGRHGLIHRAPDGAASVVVRPEQLFVDDRGAPVVVVDLRYYGPDVKVRCRLEQGIEVVARVPGSVTLARGMRTGLRVVGDVLAYADGAVDADGSAGSSSWNHGV